MLPDVAEFVVQGITVDGEVFQRRGWAEQLCSMVASVPSGTPYPSYVRPVIAEGLSSLVVRVALQQVDEKSFETIKRFVIENRLLVRAGRGSLDAEAVEPDLPVGFERRSPENNRW